MEPARRPDARQAQSAPEIVGAIDHAMAIKPHLAASSPSHRSEIPSTITAATAAILRSRRASVRRRRRQSTRGVGEGRRNAGAERQPRQRGGATFGSASLPGRERTTNATGHDAIEGPSRLCSVPQARSRRGRAPPTFVRQASPHAAGAGGRAKVLVQPAAGRPRSTLRRIRRRPKLFAGAAAAEHS